MTTRAGHSADDIITQVTQAPTGHGALAVLEMLASPAMLRVIADQLHIEAEGHGNPWIRRAIVREARS